MELFILLSKMKLSVLKKDGSKGSSVTVDKTVFGIKPNESVVHQAITAELANGRQGTHASKNRSAVRGGGKKPWKQKGRGVARAGTNRSPIWKGGGVVFGPEPHGYNKKTTKKMRRLARKSVLSDRVKNGKFIVIDDISHLNNDGIFKQRQQEKSLASAPLRLIIPGLSSLRTHPTRD